MICQLCKTGNREVHWRCAKGWLRNLLIQVDPAVFHSMSTAFDQVRELGGVETLAMQAGQQILARGDADKSPRGNPNTTWQLLQRWFSAWAGRMPERREFQRGSSRRRASGSGTTIAASS